MKRARAVLDRLAQRKIVPLEVDAGALNRLLEGLRQLNVLGAILEDQSPDPKTIREKQGLSQPDFACLYGLEVDTLRNWEQHRYAPDGPARTLLSVIEQCPHVVILARLARDSRRDLAEAFYQDRLTDPPASG
ncbi:MAG: hypothetical protein JOY90_11655 [Bradyrhizobium sp.]|nr:hypothetical protein [Bradyrhizobium sp.]